MSSLPRTLAIAAAIAAPLLLGGCLQRTIHITSDPPGALVWLNDIEVGRTPLETDFTHYGKFSVRLRREGFEPISTSRTAATPVYEWPVIDLAAEVWPQRIATNIHWHFDLVPAAERTDANTAREDVLRRAAETRDLLSQP